MKNRKLMFISVFLFGLGQTYLNAQEAILASGGNASGRGGSVSYSVGMVVYTSNLGFNGSVTQGVQQPYEISFMRENDDSSLVNINCSVFPNPGSDFLTLKVENYSDSALSYQLYNIVGQKIEEKSIYTTQTNVAIDWLVPAIYFLKIMKYDQEIKTFKIIKRKVQ